ncbi:hypothetical protein SESBI_18010 [Sesbania bispinosa]|nr:hypothetical protein SESBI_18010 [Sesbania bispinosa]
MFSKGFSEALLGFFHGCNRLVQQPEVHVQTTETGGAATTELEHNPTIHQGVIVADEILHGDWISDTKHKRDPKREGKDQANNLCGSNIGKEAVKGDQGSHPIDLENKFSKLTNQVSANDGVIFMAQSKEVRNDVSANSNAVGPSKVWSRKKRPRKELVFIQPKIFTYNKTQATVQGVGNEAQSSKPKNVGDGNKGPDSVVLTPGSVKHHDGIKNFPHNLKTTMDVEYLAPNRLRFIEEPKPPDPPTCQGSMLESAHDGRPVCSGAARDDHIGGDGSMGEEPNMMHDTP